MFLSNGAVIPSNMQGRLGDESPMFHNASYYGTNVMPLAGGSWAAYGGLYKAQLWIGIVVRKRAVGAARMPFEIMLTNPDGVQVLERGQLQELMDAPNRRMTPFMFWQWIMATRDVYGEAHLMKIRDNRGRVRELQPVHPRNVELRMNDDGELEYIYMASPGSPVSGMPPIPEIDMVTFKNYNPDNTLRGLSNLESLRMTLFNEDASRRATSSFWNKGARPSMILTHPNELSKGAQDRLKERAEQAQGGVDNMGGVAVFEEGITATITQLSNEDMQYIESRKLNREEVCAAYDMSPVAVHILDHATFSNVTEQLRSVYRDTMAPIFTDLQQTIRAQLVPDFYPETGAAAARFNMDDVLRGDYEARATTGLALRQSGVFSGNEARDFIGTDPSTDPNMDLIFANSALQPLGATPGRIGGPVPPASNAGGAAAAAAEAGREPPAGRQLDADLAAMRKLAGRNFLGRPALRGIMGKIPARLARTKDRAEIAATMFEAHRDALHDYYAALHDEIRANLEAKAVDPAGLFDRKVWDANLKEVLSVLATKTAAAAGEAQAAELGSMFTMSAVEDWLDLNCELGAELFNTSTAETLADMLSADFEDEAAKLAALDDTFEEGGLMHARADEQARTRTTVIGEFAAHDAAKRSDGQVTKTWHTNSVTPRKSHQRVNGEVVGVDENFSIGMLYPGDWAGGFDEIAGCQCTVSYSKESD